MNNNFDFFKFDVLLRYLLLYYMFFVFSTLYFALIIILHDYCLFTKIFLVLKINLFTDNWVGLLIWSILAISRALLFCIVGNIF